MHPNAKELITRAFVKLGPERVEKGLIALQDLSRPNWYPCCFLGESLNSNGYVYISRGSLYTNEFEKQNTFIVNEVKRLLTPFEVSEVNFYFDEFRRKEFHELALEWLELNREVPVQHDNRRREESCINY